VKYIKRDNDLKFDKDSEHRHPTLFALHAILQFTNGKIKNITRDRKRQATISCQIPM
jgi:hypothetical protein